LAKFVATDRKVLNTDEELKEMSLSTLQSLLVKFQQPFPPSTVTEELFSTIKTDQQNKNLGSWA